MDLSYDNPVAELGPGDLFGEMTCMSLYPRSATVRAETDCTMLEMLRNVLDIMQRNKNFRAQLDESYRQRALDSHLRAVPVFAELTDEFIGSLRERVELVRYRAGPGDLPPGRARRQLLSGAHRLRESVAERIPAARWCWPIFRAANISARRACCASDVRTATCTALDHVELVRIGARRFQPHDRGSSPKCAESWKPWSRNARR